MPRPRATAEMKAFVARFMKTLNEIRELDPPAAAAIERKIQDTYTKLRKRDARRRRVRG